MPCHTSTESVLQTRADKECHSQYCQYFLMPCRLVCPQLLCAVEAVAHLDLGHKTIIYHLVDRHKNSLKSLNSGIEFR